MAVASTDVADAHFLEEELVGEYSFSESHMQRFTVLHKTMQNCGYSFIVVAGATVLTVLAQARASLPCCPMSGIGAHIRLGHFMCSSQLLLPQPLLQVSFSCAAEGLLRLTALLLRTPRRPTRRAVTPVNTVVDTCCMQLEHASHSFCLLSAGD